MGFGVGVGGCGWTRRERRENKGQKAKGRKIERETGEFVVAEGVTRATGKRHNAAQSGRVETETNECESNSEGIDEDKRSLKDGAGRLTQSLQGRDT